MPITLTSDPVSARDTELKFEEALNAFYKTFFSGAPHDSQLGSPVTFPDCDLYFNQAQLAAPAAKDQIHTVISDMRSRERWETHTTKLVFADATLSIFIRTANQGDQDNKTDHRNRKTADNVKEIFESQDRYALARCGIRHPKIQRGPAPLPTIGFQVRLIVLTCQLQYRIPRTGA